MPTYEYRCRSCGEHLEVVQSFTDNPLTVCPACSGALRKVFSPIGIAFKGSGFYRTDSRSGSDKADGADGSSDKRSSEGSPKVEKSSTGSSDTSAAGSTSTQGSEAKSA